MDISVCIPTIHPRFALLNRALASVEAQTLQPAEVIVVEDTNREGAAATRNKALAQATSEFVAFLDDDDEFLPHHLEALAAEQQRTNADLVYPWYEAVARVDPLTQFGRPFDPVALREANYIPVTVLARTEAVRAAGGFVNYRERHATWEDWQCWVAMLNDGCTFVHLPERTWRWHFDGDHTGGDPLRW